ncbi:uncharacterized protein MONOS_8784 [Monocercomonoides exilis]|uniref:uncharacterized protein n=1 Tax=Monocercomonoides exilis TaxID=2049356 RepID=UPI00355A9FC4|nr:hypothetical protein MONOS_8784 [Monocercomonoides exilis]|eukprot:MONOS_8784.1-p1 / transcript=MONOS_8784.1 / gene=MONOS_8784 / organism=Monocercomonoides_exilis_PA203 / gene_product=unspecified product / transcript_product=unspecified product / location=Mono_scaffold00341:25585-27006(-) / protein_length=473 / sequence_SO=supercontig / SO=protein_coding / is_pseudo=false
MDLEKSKGGSVERSINAYSRREFSTRSIEDNLAECTLRDGKQWWKNAMEQKSIPFSLSEECRADISRSTWRGYLYGFAHFGKQWKECEYGKIPDSIQEWAACCANVFLSLGNGGMKLTCLQLTRAAVSPYSNIVFSSFLGDIPIIRPLFRSFRRTDKSRKKKTGDIWNPRIVLNFFSGLGTNEGLSFRQLTRKVIVLTMLFSACRFTELERINMLESRFEEEGVYLDTKLKTSNTRTEIAVPFLPEPSLICPASAIQELWKRVQEKNSHTDKLLLNAENFHPLAAEGIRKLAKEAIYVAGVPKRFTPYSIKAASLSALTMAGIPPEQVGRFARLSPRTNTLVKHYFRSNLASSMARVIASATNDQEDRANREDANSTAMCRRSEAKKRGGNEKTTKPHANSSICQRENSEQRRNEEQPMKPTRVEEPTEGKGDTPAHGEDFIIRTRAQIRKETEEKQRTITRAVLMMVSSSPN